MNPSPAAIAAIRAKVTVWPTDAAVRDSLNAPNIANPVTQPNVPAPVYESALLSLLTDPANGSLVKLIDWNNFGLLKADIEANNRDGIGLWCQALTLAGTITQGECGAILAYLASTVPDPNWPALVSWASLNIGRDLDLDDIAAARLGA